MFLGIKNIFWPLSELIKPCLAALAKMSLSWAQNIWAGEHNLDCCICFTNLSQILKTFHSKSFLSKFRHPMLNIWIIKFITQLSIISVPSPGSVCIIENGSLARTGVLGVLNKCGLGTGPRIPGIPAIPGGIGCFELLGLGVWNIWCSTGRVCCQRKKKPLTDSLNHWWRRWTDKL